MEYRTHIRDLESRQQIGNIYAWQDELTRRLAATPNGQGFIIVQPPGSGKTRAINIAFKECMKRRSGSGLIVVAEPYKALVNQICDDTYEGILDAYAPYYIKNKLYQLSTAKERDRGRLLTVIYEAMKRLPPDHEAVTQANAALQTEKGLNRYMTVTDTHYLSKKDLCALYAGSVATHQLPMNKVLIGTYENIAITFQGLDSEALDRTGNSTGMVQGTRVDMVIIDEFHNINKDRGVYIDSILRAVSLWNKSTHEHKILVMLLSGTAPQCIRNLLNGVKQTVGGVLTTVGGFPSMNFANNEIINERGKPYAVYDWFGDKNSPERKELTSYTESAGLKHSQSNFVYTAYIKLIEALPFMPPGWLSLMFLPTKGSAEVFAMLAYAYLREKGLAPVIKGSAIVYTPQLAGKLDVFEQYWKPAAKALGISMSMQDAITQSSAWLDMGVYLDHSVSNDPDIRAYLQGDNYLGLRVICATTTIAEGVNIKAARLLALDYEHATESNATESDEDTPKSGRDEYWDWAKYRQMLGRVGRFSTGFLFSTHTYEELAAKSNLPDTSENNTHPIMDLMSAINYYWELFWSAWTSGQDSFSIEASDEFYWRQLDFNTKQVHDFFVGNGLCVKGDYSPQGGNKTVRIERNIVYIHEYLNEEGLSSCRAIPRCSFKTGILALRQLMRAMFINEIFEYDGDPAENIPGLLHSKSDFKTGDATNTYDYYIKWDLEQNLPRDFILGLILGGDRIWEYVDLTSPEAEALQEGCHNGPLVEHGLAPVLGRISATVYEKVSDGVYTSSKKYGFLDKLFPLMYWKGSDHVKHDAYTLDTVWRAITYLPYWFVYRFFSLERKRRPLYTFSIKQLMNNIGGSISFWKIFMDNNEHKFFDFVGKYSECVFTIGCLMEFNYQNYLHGWSLDYKAITNIALKIKVYTEGAKPTVMNRERATTYVQAYTQQEKKARQDPVDINVDPSNIMNVRMKYPALFALAAISSDEQKNLKYYTLPLNEWHQNLLGFMPVN